MYRKICLVGIVLCMSLCACEKEVPETAENLPEEDTAFVEVYQELIDSENAQGAALFYLDGDSVPELLLLQEGEYLLYTLEGGKTLPVDMPYSEINAAAWGPRYDPETEGAAAEQTFYWFAYVPYEGLIRVQSVADQERRDYYLRYGNGKLFAELAAGSEGYVWHTYAGEGEIENEEFLSRLSSLGYDGLIPCGVFYENAETAYEKINTIPDSKMLLEKFVSGEMDALDHVEETGFVWKSFAAYYEEIVAGEEEWGSIEYADFDNDGAEELILRGYGYAGMYFDVIGDTVYKVLYTGGTADESFVAERDGRKVIARADLLHGGRKSLVVMQYDACGCLTDLFRLYTEYPGGEYTEEDRFRYREREIGMEEFEALWNSIRME